MISDFVKGKKKFDYPVAILKGIMLHRAIDTFTDDHPATKKAKQFFKPAVGLYAGAFVDVAYDHFLANDPLQFSDENLLKHAAETYAILTKNTAVLPMPFKVMLPYMIEHNWLYNYKSKWGMQQSFGGVARRAKYLDSSAAVYLLFEKHYLELLNCYKEFFPALKAFATAEFQLL